MNYRSAMVRSEDVEMAQAFGHFGRIMNALLDELFSMGEQKSCIGAGAVLTSVLHQLGYPAAYPMTVRVRILNPKATQLADEAGWKPVPLPPEGTLCVSVGEPGDSLGPDMWPGHLVVIVPRVVGEKHLMFDPTIIQANQLEHGIDLQPLMIPVMDDFTSGEKVRKVTVNGSTLVYKSFPDDKSYQDKSNWKELIASRLVVDRVLARLNGG